MYNIYSEYYKDKIEKIHEYLADKQQNLSNLIDILIAFSKILDRIFVVLIDMDMQIN